MRGRLRAPAPLNTARAPHVLHREQRLPLAPTELFPFFADAGNLARITPPELAFAFETPLPIEMRAGVEIGCRLRLWGVRFRWRTRIAAWDPPHGFVDEQIRGPYRFWRHTHTFRLVSGGETVMLDRVEYALPLAPFGELAHFVVRHRLDRIFDYRRDAVADLFSR
jgi:ligand-binding SRPBCC domain-containing protein